MHLQGSGACSSRAGRLSSGSLIGRHICHISQYMRYTYMTVYTVYIYGSIYVYICTYAHICVYMHIYAHMHMHTHVYIHRYDRIYICDSIDDIHTYMTVYMTGIPVFPHTFFSSPSGMWRGGDREDSGLHHSPAEHRYFRSL